MADAIVGPAWRIGAAGRVPQLAARRGCRRCARFFSRSMTLPRVSLMSCLIWAFRAPCASVSSSVSAASWSQRSARSRSSFYGPTLGDPRHARTCCGQDGDDRRDRVALAVRDRLEDGLGDDLLRSDLADHTADPTAAGDPLGGAPGELALDIAADDGLEPCHGPPLSGFALERSLCRPQPP